MPINKELCLYLTSCDVVRVNRESVSGRLVVMIEGRKMQQGVSMRMCESLEQRGVGIRSQSSAWETKPLDMDRSC